jgi:hypothetical protein
VESTDPRGIAVARTVDAADRVTLVDYPDDSLDTTYAYDSSTTCPAPSFPVGRMAAIERDGEAIEYCWDRFGRLTRDGALTFAHDGNGNRTEVGYPGGLMARYGYL